MYCTNCGKELDPEARFCTHCGNPVSADARAAQSTQVLPAQPSGGEGPTAEGMPAVPAAQHPDGGQAPAAGSPSPAQGLRTRNIAVVALVLIALLAAALSFAFCSSRQAETPSSQDAVGSSDGLQAASTSSNPSSGPPSSSADEAEGASSSQSAVPEESLSPEEAAVKALDGWWAGLVPSAGLLRRIRQHSRQPDRLVLLQPRHGCRRICEHGRDRQGRPFRREWGKGLAFLPQHGRERVLRVLPSGRRRG